MRVLFVATAFPPEAQTGRAAEFAGLWRRVRDWASVTQLVVGTSGEHPLPLGAVGVPRWPGIGSLQVWRAAREAGRRMEPQLVVMLGLGLRPLPWPTLRLVRDLVDDFGRPSTVGRAARFAARRAACLVVPSSRVRQRLFDLGVDRWRVEKLPVAVPDDIAPPLPPAGTPVRLVHPGSIRLAKGQHLSIDAVSRLPPEFKAMVTLDVVGPVADPRYAAQLRLAARRQPVRFPNHTAQHVISEAHAALCVDAAEPAFPDAAVRTMAMGRMVMWADHQSSRDVLGPLGVAVAPDPQRIRQALMASLPTADWAAEGARARAFAIERYGWRAVWPQWQALLSRYGS